MGAVLPVLLSVGGSQAAGQWEATMTAGAEWGASAGAAGACVPTADPGRPPPRGAVLRPAGAQFVSTLPL